MNILYLLLGWFLGLLSPRILNAVEQHYKRREFIVTTLREFDGLRFKMMLTAYRVFSKHAAATREFVQWMLPILRNYSGPDLSDERLRDWEALETLNDEQLRLLHKETEDVDRTILVPRMDVPFTSANLQSLAVCPKDFQERILNLRGQLEFYNHEADDLRRLHERTFDSSLSEENWKRVLTSIAEYEQAVGRRAHGIALRVSTLIDKYSVS